MFIRVAKIQLISKLPKVFNVIILHQIDKANVFQYFIQITVVSRHCFKVAPNGYLYDIV